MSNDIPPRACLADSSFIKMVIDPELRSEGDKTIFMSPELFLPWTDGFTESMFTPEADVCAFGSVIYQVCENNRDYPPFTYIFQVLTGELPFAGHGLAEITLKLAQGARPAKPKNASAIGFSDSLWSFVERCWDGEIESRPKVAEIVAQLERAAADWGEVMPPHAHVNSVAFAFPEPVSDLMAYCEFEILTLP